MPDMTHGKYAIWKLNAGKDLEAWYDKLPKIHAVYHQNYLQIATRLMHFSNVLL